MSVHEIHILKGDEGQHHQVCIHFDANTSILKKNLKKKLQIRF